MQLYLRVGFSSPAQAPFSLICTGDSVGRGYHPHIMPRPDVSLKILRFIYFAIFDSYLLYCCLVWAQNFSSIQQNVISQRKKKKKAARIINFQPRNFHTSPIFKQNLILKFQDKIFLESILFASKSFSSLSPSIFNAWFRFSSDQHNYETSSSMQGNHMKPFYKTNRYGKYSMGSIQL